MSPSTLLSLLILLSSTQAIRWKQCGTAATSECHETNAENEAEVGPPEVSGCGDAILCPLVKGQLTTIKIPFTPKKDITSATVHVYGILGPMRVPFLLKSNDACSDSGLSCPLSQQQSHVYTTSIEVEPSYPEVRVKIEWELRDQDDQKIFCIMFGAVITP